MVTSGTQTLTKSLARNSCGRTGDGVLKRLCMSWAREEGFTRRGIGKGGRRGLWMLMALMLRRRGSVGWGCPGVQRRRRVREYGGRENCVHVYIPQLGASEALSTHLCYQMFDVVSSSEDCAVLVGVNKCLRLYIHPGTLRSNASQNRKAELVMYTKH